MKKTMTAALVIALLLAATGCKGNDTPAETTGAVTTTAETTTAETTTAETTTETTVMTTVTTETTTETNVTTEITTEAEPALPEFDINAPECLPYRLLGMTVEEIEAEYGELTDLYMTHGVPHPQYKLYLNDTDYFELTFSAEGSYTETANGIKLNRDAFPINVSIETDTIKRYPDIKSTYTPAEVSQIIPRWDSAWIHPEGGNCVTTELYVGDYIFTIMWETPEEMYEQLQEKLKEKTTEEKEMICQEYADEFMKNFNNYNVEIIDIYVKTIGGTKNE